MNRRQLGQHAGQGLVFSVFGPGFGGGAGAAPNVTLENGTALVSTDGGNALVSGSDGGALLTGGSIRASLDSTLGGTFWRVPASDPLLAYDAGAREISIVGGNAVTLPVASTSEAGLFSAEDKRATALARTTRAAITSENVPAAVTAFRTTGYTSAGDGGGALYLRVGAEPAHAGKVQSGDGAWWELQPDPYLNARQIGAQGDDTTDDTLAIKDWLDTAVALGAPAFLPDGVYLMQTGIDVLLSASLSVTCARDATLKAGAIDRVLLRITSPDTDPSAFFSLLWQGGIFDTSQALFGIGEGAGSGLQPRRLNNVVIRDATFTTRTPRDATPLRGDSGITSVEVFSMLIEGCRFFGHPDAGVYLSGGASSSTDDDGGFTKILSCDFEECVSAITVKRQARETIILANTIRLCNNGVDILPTGGNPFPGRRALIANNTIVKTVSSPIDVRAGTGFVISGNLIEDWGFEDDGITKIATTSIPGTRVLGARETVITGNVFQMSDWPGTADHIGVLLGSFTENGVVLDAGQTSIASNRFEGVATGIREQPGQGPLFGSANSYGSASVAASLEHPDSIDVSLSLNGGDVVVTGGSALAAQDGGVLTRAQGDARYMERLDVRSETAGRALTQASDAGAYLRADLTADADFTVEAGFAAGESVLLRQTGSGAITLVAGSGVTLQAPFGGSLTSAGTGATLTLVAVGGGVFDVGGDTLAP